MQKPLDGQWLRPSLGTVGDTCVVARPVDRDAKFQSGRRHVIPETMRCSSVDRYDDARTVSRAPINSPTSLLQNNDL